MKKYFALVAVVLSIVFGGISHTSTTAVEGQVHQLDIKVAIDDPIGPMISKNVVAIDDPIGPMAPIYRG